MRRAAGYAARCAAPILAAAVVAGTGTAAGAAARSNGPTVAHAAGPATVVVHIRPTGPRHRLKPNWSITRHLYGGQCTDGSEAVIGADRCFVGNVILDPCWPTFGPYGHYRGSYCPRAPWRRDGAMISGHHETSGVRKGHSPWALETGQGRRCVIIEGASSLYHGKRINFYCDARHALVGRPDKTYLRWTILQLTYDTNHDITSVGRVGLNRAWIGISPYGR